MTICCLIAIIMVYTCINSITAIPACLLYIACCTGINRLAIISGNINTRMPVTAITAKGISATAERRGNITATGRPLARSNLTTIVLSFNSAQQIF